MMRSMYSAVSGLKTHQTRMDVIGNNIANVNTVAFKSSSVTFSDILYQTTSNASGANATTGTGGVNAKQIGLGTTAAATKVSITSAGASETTGNPFDIRLTDKNSTNFFIVNNGSENVFTRSGSFYVDGSGNLCMSSTGYTVMGWQVDETTGEIRKDTVSALRIMQEKNLTSAPEATTQATIAGVLDENDTDVKNDAGRVMNLNFYDNLGYQYTAKFAIKSTGTDGKYTVELTSVLDRIAIIRISSKILQNRRFHRFSVITKQMQHLDNIVFQRIMSLKIISMCAKQIKKNLKLIMQIKLCLKQQMVQVIQLALQRFSPVLQQPLLII